MTAVRKIVSHRRSPKCPICGNILTFISSDARGYADLKCGKCRKPSMVDLSSLEAIPIVEDHPEAERPRND